MLLYYRDCRAVLFSRHDKQLNNNIEFLYDSMYDSISHSTILQSQQEVMIIQDNYINDATSNHLRVRSTSIVTSSTSINEKSNKWLDIGGKYYYHINYNLEDQKEYKVECLTMDHSCQVPLERIIVSSLSSDINPLRASEIGKKNFGLDAPVRVAGTLAITRALGDSYLKREDISLPTYKAHVPYITCKPTIYHKTITSNDISLILASDGLWNHVTAKECYDVLMTSFTDTRTDTNTNTKKTYMNENDSNSDWFSISSHSPISSKKINIEKDLPFAYVPHQKEGFLEIASKIMELPFSLESNENKIKSLIKKRKFHGFESSSNSNSNSYDMSHSLLSFQENIFPSEDFEDSSSDDEDSSIEQSKKEIKGSDSKCEYVNVTDKLMKLCLVNSMKNSQIDTSFGYQNSRLFKQAYSRRDIIDDVTIMNIPLS